jgi:hypothetical protein
LNALQIKQHLKYLEFLKNIKDNICLQKNEKINVKVPQNYENDD